MMSQREHSGGGDNEDVRGICVICNSQVGETFSNLKKKGIN